MGKLGLVVLAAAGGLVAGLLLAPKSGKEMRQDLKDKAWEYKGKAQDGMEEVKKGTKVVAQNVRQTSKDVGQAVRQ